MNFRGRYRRRRVLIGVAITVVVLIVAVASIPAIGTIRILTHWAKKDASPPPTIATLLDQSFALRVPAGTSLQSARLPAGMDSAGLYELILPPGSDLVETLIAVAQSKKWEIETGPSADPGITGRYPGVQLPSWWTPGSIANLQWTRLANPQSACYYHIGWSSGERRVLIYWMTT